MEKQEIVTSSLANLVSDIKEIINKGRREAYSEVNAVMISTYWKIGRRIVTEEQNGQKRAEYGKGLIDALARELTHDMGEGYSPRYLRAFRKFYTLFPDEENWKSRFPNLTWTHIFQTLRASLSASSETGESYLFHLAEKNGGKNLAVQFLFTTFAEQKD